MYLSKKDAGLLLSVVWFIEEFSGKILLKFILKGIRYLKTGAFLKGNFKSLSTSAKNLYEPVVSLKSEFNFWSHTKKFFIKMFSKSCKYAIRAVLYLAVNSNEQTKIGVQNLSDDLDVPKHFLAKILQQLSKHNLISSIKGPGGGFYLSEQNIKARLQNIVESIDGSDVFHSCILGLPICSSENPCPLHTQAYAYREGLLQLIAHQTIEELAAKVKNEGLKL